MISFQPTEDEEAFIKVAKNVATEKIRPMAGSVEDNRQVPESITEEVRNLGFLSMELPEGWEGLELPLVSQVQILQALSYGDLGIVQGLPGVGDAASVIRQLHENDMPGSNSDILMHYKTEIMKGLQPTIALLDVADTEEPWSDALSVRQQDEGYVLHGTTLPVRLGAKAEYVLVAATDADGEQVVFALDQYTPWEVKEGDYRLGLLAAGVARLAFDHTKVAKSHVLATGDTATELITKMHTRVHILQAAKEVGLMEAALDYATEYTADRKAFGQEIAKFQGVSFRIARMAMETRMANHLTLHAASKTDANDPDAAGYAMSALHRSHRALRYVSDSAVQLLGGHGFVKDFPVEKWMRDAQAQVSLFGYEQDLLAQRGEQVMEGSKEVIFP